MLRIREVAFTLIWHTFLYLAEPQNSMCTWVLILLHFLLTFLLYSILPIILILVYLTLLHDLHSYARTLQLPLSLLGGWRVIITMTKPLKNQNS